MNELTDSNRRRRKSKSKDFENSMISKMLNASPVESNNTDNNATPVESVNENNSSPTPEAEVKNDIKVESESKPEAINSTPNTQSTITSDIFKKLPKKTDSSNEVVSKNANGMYVLKRNTIYHKVKKVGRTITIRVDLLKILDDISAKNDGNGSYTKGLKAAVVNNALLKEYYSLGLISEEDMQREIEPYE